VASGRHSYRRGSISQRYNSGGRKWAGSSISPGCEARRAYKGGRDNRRLAADGEEIPYGKPYPLATVVEYITHVRPFPNRGHLTPPHARPPKNLEPSSNSSGITQ
jgi:hypothetical protein